MGTLKIRMTMFGLDN